VSDYSLYTAPPRPGPGVGSTQPTIATAQNVGFWNYVPNVNLDPFWSALPGANLGSFWSGITDLTSLVKASLFLLRPRNWLRIFEALLGTVMLLLGLYYLGQGDGGEEITLAGAGRLAGRPRELGGGAARGAGRLGRTAAKGTLVGRGASLATSRGKSRARPRPKPKAKSKPRTSNRSGTTGPTRTTEVGGPQTLATPDTFPA
jgi:hypothetical protein